jgi:hypothetical protein
MSETTKHHARVIWRGDKRDLRAHEIKLANQLSLRGAGQVGGGILQMVVAPGQGNRRCLRELDQRRDEVLHRRRHPARDGARAGVLDALSVGGRRIEGADLLRSDERGKITEIWVLIRPLADIAAFAGAVGSPLAAKRGSGRAPLLRFLTLPLKAILLVADAVASRLVQRR